MKEFDLKKAIAGAKVITREGGEVLNVRYYPNSEANLQIIADVKDFETPIYPHTYYADGRFWDSGESSFDLFMADDDPDEQETERPATDTQVESKKYRIMKRLQNKKVYVGKYSKKIQEKAFELGFTWLGDKVVDYLNKPFLYFDYKHITHGADVRNFNSHENEEITAEEILSIKVEPKFKPDQLVLVRNNKEGEWRLNRYSHNNEDPMYSHFCFGDKYTYCIPYEGNEELLGTNKMTNN